MTAPLPPTVATWDFLYNWYLFFGLGAAIIVIGMMVFFMIKYRARGNEPPAQHKVEGWKIVLVTVLISLTVLSAAEYQTFASFSNIEIPKSGDPVYIHVLAYQWGWNFTYPNGMYSIDNLTVPVGEQVILNITSRDVFHSFGLSMLDVKEDAIPGKVNQAWFEVPTQRVPASAALGVVCNAAGTSCTYVDAVRCFELCGIGHAFMIGNLTVVSQSAWNAWMTQSSGGTGGTA